MNKAAQLNGCSELELTLSTTIEISKVTPPHPLPPRVTTPWVVAAFFNTYSENLKVTGCQK